MPQSKANVSVDMPVPPREETREGHMGSTAQPPNPAPASPASGSVPEVGGASPSPAMQPDTAASPNNKKDTSQDFLTLAGNRAATVVNKVDSILKSLSEIAELLEALRLDFKRLRSDKTIPAGSTIMECSSFPEFCEKVLGRKKQTVYEALEKWRDEQEALPIGHTTFKKAESAGKTKTKTPQTQPTSKNISPPSDPPGSSSSVKKTVIHADPGPQLVLTKPYRRAPKLVKLKISCPIFFLLFSPPPMGFSSPICGPA